MKEAELRENAECKICNRKLGQLPIPIFHIVRIERFGLDMAAVARQQGLAMMLDGHAHLASVMGPDEDMAKSLCKAKLMICDECLTSRLPPQIFQAYEESEPGFTSNVRPLEEAG